MDDNTDMKAPTLFGVIAVSALLALIVIRIAAANPLEYGRVENQYVAQAEPGNPQARYGLAKAKIRQGKLAEAQSILNQLKQSNPNFAPTYYAQGELYENQGNTDAARQAYQTFIQMSGGQLPPDPEMMLKLRRMGLY